jgi:competence protein ComEA
MPSLEDENRPEIKIRFHLVTAPQRSANRSPRNVIQTSLEEALKMDFLRYRCLPAFLLLVLAGCTQKETPQQLQRQTAQATAEAKSDVKAVAEGIREGWSRDRPLDLNTATKADLVSLPGVTTEEADRVIADRPYKDPGELVTRRIMSKSEYDRIADRVTARR